jgi:beta-glucosidase
LKTSAGALSARGSVEVSVDVKNTGARVGEEVVQMYVRHLNSAVERPSLELKGFSRIALEPGQTKMVTLTLRGEQLAYWDSKRGAFTVEPDRVRVMVGRSSADIIRAKNIRVKP